MELRSITIRQLYSTYTLKVPIIQNRLILVGENGTGKSTFVTILNHLLCLRWYDLVEFDFESIEIEFSNKAFTIKRSEVIRQLEKRSTQMPNFPRSMREDIRRFLLSYGFPINARDLDLHSLYRNYRSHGMTGVPFSVFKEIVLSESSGSEWVKGPLKDYEEYANRFLDFSLVYLPTYRRIEKDIKKIFPHMEDQLKEGFIVRNSRLRVKRQLELIEFGMEDVSDLISEAMQSLSNHFRSSLESLTGNYLREILRYTYESVNVDRFKEENVGDIDAVFQRIDDAILSQGDKNALRARITEILGSRDLQATDKMIVHFIQSLLDIHREQKSQEARVTRFVEVCNEYLSEKRIVFFTNSFQVQILRKADNTPLPMEGLSSGEKQVISIFAHLYLSDSESFFLIIDEPELSLSVPWQKRFLLDISQSDRCAGLVAVTHSPFIYDNDLVGFTHSINEFRIKSHRHHAEEQ